MPPEAFINQSSGFQQASLCGCLGTAAACLGSVLEADEQKAAISDLIKWYKEEPFPVLQPAGLDLPTTVAESEICADSVGKFMEVQGCAYGDPERKERCAGVTADTTKKIVEMLNEKL